MKRFHCPWCGEGHSTEKEVPCLVEAVCSCGSALKVDFASEYTEVTATRAEGIVIAHDAAKDKSTSSATRAK